MQTATARPPARLQPDLAPILQDAVNVVHAPRPLDPFLAARLEAVAQRHDFAYAVRLDTAAPDPRLLLSAIEDAVAKDFLAADIRALTAQLGAILDRRHVHAKLQVIRTDGCRKIHVDHVGLRLICTYAGPGTDWLDNAHLVRENLGRMDVDIDTANRSVIRAGGALRRCAAGDVLLLKGEGHPGNDGRGAAHRSPPLGASGVARLVLKLDEHPCGC